MQTVRKASIILESPVLYAQLDIKGSILDIALTKIQVDAEFRNADWPLRFTPVFTKWIFVLKASYIKSRNFNFLAYLDLISSPPPSMKITENMVFKSLIQGYLVLLFRNQMKHVESVWICKTRYSKMAKNKNMQIFMENLKTNRNRTKKMTFWSRNWNLRFSVIFPPTIWIVIKDEGDEIKSKQAAKRDRTLLTY